MVYNTFNATRQEISSHRNFKPRRRLSGKRSEGTFPCSAPETTSSLLPAHWPNQYAGRVTCPLRRIHADERPPPVQVDRCCGPGGPSSPAEACGFLRNTEWYGFEQGRHAAQSHEKLTEDRKGQTFPVTLRLVPIRLPEALLCVDQGQLNPPPSATRKQESAPCRDLTVAISPMLILPPQSTPDDASAHESLGSFTKVVS